MQGVQALYFDKVNELHKTLTSVANGQHFGANGAANAARMLNCTAYLQRRT